MVTRVRGLAEVCCLLCGNNILMALGCTTVEVIIKKMSNKKMTSVIDDMLNEASILDCLLRAIMFAFRC